MTSPNKARGNTLERETVKAFKDAGYKAERAYGSNGKALGYTEDVDVVAKIPKDFRIQCKRKKKLPDYLVLDKVDVNYDAVVFRQDRGDQYIMMTLESFIKLLESKS